MPRTIFGSLGPLMKFSRNGGSVMSAVEPARDFERHEARRFRVVLTRDDDVDFLESSGSPQIGHEVRNGDRREGRARNPEERVLLLESSDPEVARNHVGKGVEEEDG